MLNTQSKSTRTILLNILPTNAWQIKFTNQKWADSRDILLSLCFSDDNY